MNRRTIKKDALGIIMFALGARAVWNDQSNISLLVGLMLMLFGWVTLIRSEKEASIVARRMLGKLELSQLDNLFSVAGSSEDNE